MGTWAAGPFDNDMAADFANDLDDLAAEERPAAIRDALAAVVAEQDYLDSDEGAPAVAAAAIVAAQCPDGRPVDSVYGPEKPVPALPAELRALAVQALDRVLRDDSELRELWDEADGQEWRDEIGRLRAVLESAAR